MKLYCRLVLAVVLAVGAVGCGREVRDVLDVAEQQMAQRPDSSLVLLESINTERIMSRADRARHALLYAQARDKNYIDDTSDSLISIAVDYYSRHRDYGRRFTSLYYLGRVRENAGDHTEAILAYTRAEELGDKTDDEFAKGLLYAHLGSVYARCYDLQKSLEAFRMSESYHRKAGKTAHAYYSVLSIAEICIRMGLYKDAASYINDALEWGRENNIYVYREGLYIQNYLALHDDSYCHEVFVDADHETDSMESVYDNYRTAYQEALKNNEKSARAYLALAWEDARDAQDSLNMHHYSYIVHKIIGNHEDALKEYEKFFELQDKATRQALQQPLLSVQKDYFKAQSEIQSLKLNSSRVIQVLGGILFSLLVVLLVLYYRNQLTKKQRELDDFLSLRNEFEISLSSKKGEIESMQGHIRTLFSSQYELLDQFCNICYETSSSVKEKDAIYAKVRKEIENFRSDKAVLAELEAIVNKYNNGVMRKLRAGMPILTEMEYRLICFFYAGFSAKAISIFTGDSTNNIYTKKKRLRIRILEAQPPFCEEILQYLS